MVAHPIFQIFQPIRNTFHTITSNLFFVRTVFSLQSPSGQSGGFSFCPSCQMFRSVVESPLTRNRSSALRAEVPPSAHIPTACRALCAVFFLDTGIFLVQLIHHLPPARLRWAVSFSVAYRQTLWYSVTIYRKGLASCTDLFRSYWFSYFASLQSQRIPEELTAAAVTTTVPPGNTTTITATPHTSTEI